MAKDTDKLQKLAGLSKRAAELAQIRDHFEKVESDTLTFHCVNNAMFNNVEKAFLAGAAKEIAGDILSYALDNVLSELSHYLHEIEELNKDDESE